MIILVKIKYVSIKILNKFHVELKKNYLNKTLNLTCFLTIFSHSITKQEITRVLSLIIQIMNSHILNTIEINA